MSEAYATFVMWKHWGDGIGMLGAVDAVVVSSDECQRRAGGWKKFLVNDDHDDRMRLCDFHILLLVCPDPYTFCLFSGGVGAVRERRQERKRKLSDPTESWFLLEGFMWLLACLDEEGNVAGGREKRLVVRSWGFVGGVEMWMGGDQVGVEGGRRKGKKHVVVVCVLDDDVIPMPSFMDIRAGYGSRVGW